MNKLIKCKCGNDRFWYFGKYVACPDCLNRYKVTFYANINTGKDEMEVWVCRYDTEKNEYNDTWEKWMK
jgi:hypothetical protein